MNQGARDENERAWQASVIYHLNRIEELLERIAIALEAERPAPDAWSSSVNSCLDCGTTERPHLAKGLCSRCYQRSRKSA